MESARLSERIRLKDEALIAEEAATAQARGQAEEWRRFLDLARDEVARLTERSMRVPVLEGDLALQEERLREISSELRQSTGEAAQKGQAAASFQERLEVLERQHTALQGLHGNVETELGAANERKAALEEQASRVPTLERRVAELEGQREEHQSLHSTLRETSGAEAARLAAEVQAEREAHNALKAAHTRSEMELKAATLEVIRLGSELSESRTRQESDRAGSAEKLDLLVHARAELTDQFKTLANDILEEKSRRFAEQNQRTLGQLLDPLRSQLTDFKGKVEEVYIQEGKDRSALSEQVRQLVSLNHSVSEDARNLTLALKGNAKSQGNWGELVLERVLEASGLRKGHEYHVQDCQTRDDGSRAQPDVIINLPEDRRLVVDAKMSLVAYEEHVIASTDEHRALALRRHLDSVNTHIKGLSGKQYHLLYGFKSLDFVLMFVPIEPAFMLAVTHDDAMFMQAWEKNVLLVSPSTLLFVVRTVAHLWRQEAQSKNAQDIAKRGGELYDRLSDFVKDLEVVGERLRQAQTSYEDAHRRLSTGKGNVIRQAEMLRDLGVKPTKKLPSQLIGNSGDGLFATDDLPAVEALL